jgi:hypothetical protein
MNSREIEPLERKSIHSVRLSNDLKDSVIEKNLNDLHKTVKSHIKKKKLVKFNIINFCKHNQLYI